MEHTRLNLTIETFLTLEVHNIYIFPDAYVNIIDAFCDFDYYKNSETQFL